jgi:hypothetical protein
MTLDDCAWCGATITGEAVRLDKLVFCSAECREEYELDQMGDGEPDSADLDELSADDLEELDFEDPDRLLEDEGLAFDDDDF